MLMAGLKRIIPRRFGYYLRQWRLYMRGLANRGNVYYCPLCRHSYRKMLDGGFDLPVIKKMQIIGAGRRKAVICPGCHSTDRDRLLYIYINQNVKINIKSTILHIAPEPALTTFLKKLAPDNYVAGVKYHEGFYYGKNVKLFDIKAIPYDNNLFDLILCNHVLEHIDDDIKAMQELYRVLAPGGKAIMQVPWSPLLETTLEDPSITDEAKKEELFGQFDHVRLYGNDYPQRLKNAGFLVQIIDPKMLINENIQAEKWAINLNEVIFVGEKQT
jgi:SAM-dependent methyltransferase